MSSLLVIKEYAHGHISNLTIFSYILDSGFNTKNMCIILVIIAFFLIMGHYIHFLHRNEAREMEPLVFSYKGKKFTTSLLIQRKGRMKYYILRIKNKDNQYWCFHKGTDKKWELVEGKMNDEQQASVMKALDRRFDTFNYIISRVREM